MLFPKLPDPENVFSAIDKASGVIDKGLGFIDKVSDRLDKFGITEEFPPTTTTAPKTAPVSENIASTITQEREKATTVHLATTSETGPTTEEIVAYHHKKIGKHLGALEGHYADRMRIFGKPCDCGSSKHLLMLEQFSEETIPMVDNPSIYEEMIRWVREVEPKSTDAAAKSGKYDDEYPILSGQARAFRKRVLGTTALSAMIERKEPSSSGNCPNCGGPLDKNGCCPVCKICPLPKPQR
ncbi:hypothetical protein ES707_03417 [subsurface metagenome]